MGKIIDNYNLQLQLGSGVYSTVYKAINMKTRQQVAIKMVKTDKFRELPKLEEGTINEINILSNLEPCDHIIKYYDMLKTVNNFYFVYEFCNGGTLEQLLKKVGRFEEPQALRYFKQITEAFRVLNKHNIMHRDLKPQNLLLHDGIIKIADFGFCKVLENPNEMVQTMLGSPIYMSPEILKGENYTMKADVWSLGVILFRMVFGFCPFESASIAKLILRIENDDLEFPTDPIVSPVIIQLLSRMLVKDHEKRADWSEVFRYNINEDGQISKPKDEPCLYKNSSLLMKTSTTVATESSGTFTSGDYSLHRWNTDSMKQLPITHKIKLKSRPSIKENPKDFFGQFGSGTKEETKLSGHHSSATNQSFTNYGKNKSSMIREQGCKIENHVKNHKKYVDLISLCINLAQYQTESGYALAHIITKSLEREWTATLDCIKKECAKDYEDMNAQQMYGIVMEELQHLRISLTMYEAEIHKWHVDVLDKQKLKVLKDFLKGLKLEGLDELVMASRVIDYIEEGLLIRKETYEKLSKDQLARQIRAKLEL